MRCKAKARDAGKLLGQGPFVHLPGFVQLCIQLPVKPFQFCSVFGQLILGLLAVGDID